MRLCILSAIATVLMPLCSCSPNAPKAKNSSEDASASAPRSNFVRIGQSRLGLGKSLIILRDKGTKCDWLWAAGFEIGELQARTQSSGQVCGGTAKATGFQRVSTDNISRGADIVVIRDMDTGCDWVWIDDYKSTSLKPRTDGNGQVCTGRE